MLSLTDIKDLAGIATAIIAFYGLQSWRMQKAHDRFALKADQVWATWYNVTNFNLDLSRVNLDFYTKHFIIRRSNLTSFQDKDTDSLIESYSRAFHALNRLLAEWNRSLWAIELEVAGIKKQLEEQSETLITELRSWLDMAKGIALAQKIDDDHFRRVLELSLMLKHDKPGVDTAAELLQLSPPETKLKVIEDVAEEVSLQLHKVLKRHQPGRSLAQWLNSKFKKLFNR